MAAKKSSPVFIDSRSSAMLKTDTRSVCEDTSSLLIDTQIRHAISYGGQNVIFSKAEIAQIKSIGAEPGKFIIILIEKFAVKNIYLCLAGMKILGFKPLSMITNDLNIRHASFIYPNESVKGTLYLSLIITITKMLTKIMMIGGTKMFAALLDQMLEQQKAAIAV